MFEFCIAIAIVGLVLFVVSLWALVVEWDHFWLWVAGLMISIIMMINGSVFGVYSFESNKIETPDIQQEHTEIVNQYNYCPYCGEELK